MQQRGNIIERNVGTEQLARALGWFSIGLGVAELVAPRTVANMIGVRPSVALTRAMGLREITAGVGILSQRQSQGWMWARVAGDLLDLGLLGAALMSSETRRGRTAAAAAAVAGVMVMDVVSSRQLAEEAPEDDSVRFRKSITIDRPAEELFRFWRELSNLPQVMKHLERVDVTDDRHSHWVVKTPVGTTVKWDAEITDETLNEYIAWRSLPGAVVENVGSVRFERAAGDRGTVVTVEMQYRPPAGAIGSSIAKLFGAAPDQLIEADLRPFKQLMETGEIATTEGQPSGKPHRPRIFERLAQG